MAKRANAPICERCETPFRSATSFCPGCGGPTPWATHDERVQWEVRQWRASRAASGEDSQPMMLVRTEAGYQPMPVARYNEYVWDQPLHPERERQQAPEATTAVAPVRPHEPAPQQAAPQPRTNGNGHRDGNGHHDVVDPGSSHAAAYASPTQVPGPPREQTVAEPSVAQPQAPPEPTVAAEPVLAPPSEVVEAAPVATPAPAPAPKPMFGSDDRVTVSKKAIALGIAIVLGLPFGGRIVGLLNGGPSAPAPESVAGAADPMPLVPARSGFTHSGPDSVRYAVVLKNPNKSFQASGVTVSVVFHDSRGRLVGRATEGLSVVPAAGVTGVAGTVGVAAPASRMTVSVGRAGFEETTPAKPFVVRAVRLQRSGASVVVRAGVSGVEAVRGARVVAVHLDRAGRVVGGDFTFIDVPRSPRSATAVIPTAGVPRSVTRVEVYVLR